MIRQAILVKLPALYERMLLVQMIGHSRLKLTIFACAPSNRYGSPVGFKLNHYPTAALVMQNPLERYNFSTESEQGESSHEVQSESNSCTR